MEASESRDERAADRESGPPKRAAARGANWAREFASGLIEPSQLERHGLVAPGEGARLEAVKDVFDVRVPQAFLPAGGEPAHAALARQVVPSTGELVFLPEELEDPIGDEAHTPVEGVTRRYPDRALLKVTYQCASYCRFCFRRYKVSDPTHNPEDAILRQALVWLAGEEGVFEVILTGGDPLSLTDARLQPVFDALAAMPHVGVVRIHTRIPTVLPSRVTPALVGALRGMGKAVWVVAHVNAVEELGPAADEALARLIDGGVPVLSQSVLLKGINDTPETLGSLLRGLLLRRVKPYYLHYPDLAKGTGHFRIPLARAIGLVGGLRGRLSGTAIPQLVVDIPGGHGKVTLEPASYRRLGEDQWEFRSPLHGGWIPVRYPGDTSQAPSETDPLS